MQLPRLPWLGSLGPGPTRALVRGLGVTAVALGAWLWLRDGERPSDEAATPAGETPSMPGGAPDASLEDEPRVVVVPALVPRPLPPLKFANTGKQWPATLAVAAA